MSESMVERVARALVAHMGYGGQIVDFGDAKNAARAAIAAMREPTTVTRPAPTPEEYGWLIETGDHMYWNGRHASRDGFTHDPNDAVRFARFEDGERIVYWLMKEFSVFLCTRQHKWINGCAQGSMS